IHTKEEGYKVLLALAENVGKRLRYHGQFANSISVTLKTNEFKTYSHQKHLKSSTDVALEIYEFSVAIFNKMWKYEPLRHLGISADSLSFERYEQLILDKPTDDKQRKAEVTMDKINQKLGSNKILRCSLLNSDIQVAKGSTFSKDERT
ncbi:MAG: hypothetical protein ACRCW1_04115, partial [Anaerotignaceae bacterium]